LGAATGFAGTASEAGAALAATGMPIVSGLLGGLLLLLGGLVYWRRMHQTA
jgi:hypothetical protein